ncbi:ExeM/NucH family extracellular endonuclease [Ferrimonas pelagia]|uniref:GlyGly-anchored extracellular endonuclease Xds n=1 Tax=Ferrimonas pelagia TaxID=1177826 RepID=A0ABP9EF14_9GAMM
MKIKTLSLVICSVISTGVLAGVDDLLITELTQKNWEASVGAVEITNTHATEDFTFTDDINAFIHSNGKYENELKNSDGNPLLSGVTIPAGQSLVILNTDASAEFKSTIESHGGQLIIGTGSGVSGAYDNFYLDGNDGFYLTHNGTVIDRVGAQGDTSVWAMDTTLRRRVTEAGETPAQSPTFDATQWQDINPLDASGLGSPELAPEYEAPDAFVCEPTHIIGEIQGEGHVSPVVGQTVIIEGVVTASGRYPSQGFYIRDLVPDGNPLTSDGIFVYTPDNTSDLVGKTVCMESKVSEFYGQTQLSPETWEITDENYTATQAVDIEILESDNGLFSNTLERYEGMLVRLPEDINPLQDGAQTMRVTKTFSFNYDSYRNNMTLSYLRPNMQPNQLNVAGSPEAQAAMDQNDDYRLIIESPQKADDGIIPYFPDFNADPANNYVRIDDSVVGMEGVIGYAYGDYALMVTNELKSHNFIHNIKRTESPTLNVTAPEDHFTIKVGAQNLFNYFNSPFGGDQNNFGQNRGADTHQEFAQQKSKLVEAIRKLDADALTLMEIENNGFGLRSAIADLVNEVNVYYTEERPDRADWPTSTENRYAFVGFDHNGNGVLDELDHIGYDAIATGIIYRPSKLSIERTRVITMPQQRAPSIVNDNNEIIKDGRGEALEDGQNYNRDALVVTFIVNQTGKRLTLAVNHLKSKGSTCWEDWQGVEFGDALVWTDDPADLDKQGSCAEFRVAAAVHLGEEMAKIDGDKVLIGDLNSYAQEDPMLVLTENPRNKTLTTASHTYIGHKPQFNLDGSPVEISHSYGYVDVLALKAEERGELPWSYSYNDEVGSLDHVLVTPGMVDRVIDAGDWHINAAESSLYDYNDEYKGGTTDTDNRFYQPDQFRSSDHDPAIMSLSYLPGETDPGKELRLPVWRKLLTMPYLIPDSVESQVGDVAHVGFKPAHDDDQLDLSQLVLPNVVIRQAGQSLVQMEVFGAPDAAYDVSLELRRDGTVVPGSQRTVRVRVQQRDTLVPTLVEERPDGTGGSTGLLSLLGLLGLACARRRLLRR